MMDDQFIERSIKDLVKPFQMEPFTVIPTFMTYPSNAAVMVYVEGGTRHFTLSDGGGAVGVLNGSGGYRVDGLSILKQHCQSTEFYTTNRGWISTRKPVDQNSFTSVVSLIAQFSFEASVNLLKQFKPEKHSDFRVDLERDLDRRFKDHMSRKGHLVGNSNKKQTFDYIIRIPGDRIIAIDAVVPDASSINSALVAHLDLKATGRRDIGQMIIYDDRQKWKSSDLVLLGMGALPTAYSSVHQALERISL
jgi:hypothetical protein